MAHSKRCSTGGARAGEAAPAPTLRAEPTDADRGRIRALTAAAGVFSAAEIAIAAELVDERVDRGAASGYEFVLAEHGGELVGFACYGPIPAAEGRYDLYWIVVDPAWRRAGLGSRLLAEVEQRAAAAGGVRIYVDTAGGGAYRAARRFYRRCGFRKAAKFPDFYTNGDAKVVYAKPIPAARSDPGRQRRHRR